MKTDKQTKQDTIAENAATKANAARPKEQETLRGKKPRKKRESAPEVSKESIAARDRLQLACAYLARKGEIRGMRDLGKRMDIGRSIMPGIRNAKTATLTDSFFVHFNETFGNRFNLDWLLGGRGPMLMSSAIWGTSRSIPLLDEGKVNAFGSLQEAAENDEGEQFFIPWLKEQADFLAPVQGRDMEPAYRPGDVLVCQIVPPEEGIVQWGRAYVLWTDQGMLLKRVRKSSAANRILAASDNPDYEPFELDPSDLKGMGLVVGLVRAE